MNSQHFFFLRRASSPLQTVAVAAMALSLNAAFWAAQTDHPPMVTNLNPGSSLYFEGNQGQSDPAANFLARSGKYDLFVTSEGAGEKGGRGCGSSNMAMGGST
jgi:hypothetical protein